jgi:competence protein ComEC
MRDPLVLPLFAVVAGVLVGGWLHFSLFEGAWPLFLFLVLAGLARNRWLRRISLGLALIFVGVLAEAWHRPGPPPEIDAGSREYVLVEGCVVEPSVFSEDREQFTVEIAPGARARVSLALSDDPTISKDQTVQKLTYGQRVDLEARLRSPHNYNNPGSFDYATYLARQKIFWSAAMTRGTVAQVLPGYCGSRLMGMVFALRTAALDRLERLYAGDSYSTGMMQAILIGETSKLEKIWTENFRRTGTFHALVISGAHVTVLAGVLLFLLRLCSMAEIPALTVTAAAAWLYAMVSGLSAPVVRAAGGFSLYLAARFFYRRGRIMNLLAAVALAYILWDPGQMFDASFQLSFLSVAALGALAAPLLEATSAPLARGSHSIADLNQDPHLPPSVAQFRVELRLAAETLHYWLRLPVRACAELLALGMRFLFFVFEMVLISTVIQIGLALPMAEYFHRVSFTGLTANLVIVPLMEAVVPIGFLAIFSSWHWVAAISGWMLHVSARVADWHANLEPPWRIPDPPFWLALGFAAALIALAALVGHKVWRWLAGAAVLALFTLLLWQPWPAAIEPHTLELTAIDVGQGDSLLVIFPQGQRMVVDGGGLLQFGRVRKSNLDTGEDVVSPYLWSRDIRRIDILVMTHSHQDHAGGIAAIMNNFRPREFWVGANADPALLEQAARLHIRVIPMRASPPFAFSGAQMEVRSPPADYDAPSVGNNDSLAFRIVYGARSFLLTGDMESPMEQRILVDGRAGHSDVLKVGHHGSKTSTTEPFLDAVNPSIAIISAGFENSFGHPHRDVLGRLKSNHTAILRTDLDGLVTTRTDGRRIWFDKMSWDEADGGTHLGEPAWGPPVP